MENKIQELTDKIYTVKKGWKKVMKKPKNIVSSEEAQNEVENAAERQIHNSEKHCS